MMSNSLSQEFPRILLSADQIRKRVQEMARQIAKDFAGKTVHMVGVLENGFVFMSDLMRELDLPLVSQLVRGEYKQPDQGTMEIFYTPELDVHGKDVLLVEGLIESGITSEFLIRNLMGRGASSVKLAVLLDKQTSRRVSLQPDYFGFLMSDVFVVGYGLGAPHLGRNLPYIAAKS
jgi:hypoxanthine phosphoribosyltransferase